MDIELYPSTDEKLLYGETSTTSQPNKQGAADHSSTASTSSQGPNVNVVESVISLQQDMATVTNTLQSLDKALKVLTSKRTAQVDEVSEIPPKMARSDINSDLSSLFAGAEEGRLQAPLLMNMNWRKTHLMKITFYPPLNLPLGQITSWARHWKTANWPAL